ncbi:MAG: hypothetical protein ABI390_06310, partial [Daejeonella sp.]
MKIAFLTIKTLLISVPILYSFPINAQSGGVLTNDAIEQEVQGKVVHSQSIAIKASPSAIYIEKGEGANYINFEF